MFSRFVLIAAATLMSASAYAAGPARPSAQSAAQPQPESQVAPAQVMLASADDVRASATADQQAPAARKRPRIARVTTCRCGDPQAQQEQ
jgi:hypothetical protein